MKKQVGDLFFDPLIVQRKRSICLAIAFACFESKAVRRIWSETFCPNGHVNRDRDTAKRFSRRKSKLPALRSRLICPRKRFLLSIKTGNL
jgi:hypothetical protein